MRPWQLMHAGDATCFWTRSRVVVKLVSVTGGSCGTFGGGGGIVRHITPRTMLTPRKMGELESVCASVPRNAGMVRMPERCAGSSATFDRGPGLPVSPYSGAFTEFTNVSE